MSKQTKQKGMAALIVTITVLMIVTIITLFTARVIITDHKIYQNVQGNSQAFNAAQAGFDYGLGNLNASPFAVLSALGYCAAANASTTLSGFSLPDGSTYSLTYSCVTAGSFNAITLSAIGVASDNTATRTVRATLKQFCGVTVPVIAKGNVTVGTVATPRVVNNFPNATRTIISGASVIMNSGGSTTTSTGSPYVCSSSSPYAAGVCLDVTPSAAGFSSISNSDLEKFYLGNSINNIAMQATPANTITCSVGGGAKIFTNAANPSGANVCTVGAGIGTLLAGTNTGKIIYINMTAGAAGSPGRQLQLTTTNGGTAALGSVANPVVLVIRGASTVYVMTSNSANSNITLNGNIYVDSNAINALRIIEGTSGVITINGLVYANGQLSVTSGARVNGAAVSAGPIVISGTPDGGVGNVLYDTAGANFINNTFQNLCGGSYGIVSGSWRDF